MKLVRLPRVGGDEVLVEGIGNVALGAPVYFPFHSSTDPKDHSLPSTNRVSTETHRSVRPGNRKRPGSSSTL
jgi:hypothetical protein